jgi:hypothetical protein
VSTVDRDLRMVIGAALVCGAVVVSVQVTVVRVLFAVPLCLVLPGYAIAAATFGPTRPAATRMLMLVPALSLSTLVVGSLLLDLLPGGIRLGSWTILLVVVVIAGAGVAIVRRVGSRRPPRRATRLRLRARDVILLLFAALAMGGALALSRTPLPAHKAIGYTSLWMLQSGTAYAPAVRIGVRSAELHPTTYRLTLTTGSGPPAVVDPALTLAPGEASTVNVPLILATPSNRTLVTAQLYRAGSPDVYRHVSTLVSPPPSGAP